MKTSYSVFQTASHSNLLLSNEELVAWLDNEHLLNSLSSAEFHLAKFVLSQIETLPVGQQNLHVFIAIKLCRQLLQQSTCFELADLSKDKFLSGANLSLPSINEWQQIINESHLFGSGALFYLDGQFVYFTRYYHNERLIADFVNQMQAIKPAHVWLPDEVLSNKSEIVKSLFESFNGEAGDVADDFDWQKHAVNNSLSHRFSIITGGPGTGKTTTVMRLLASLLIYHDNLEGFNKALKPTLSMALVAPTGKAALRLSESVQSGLKRLEIADELKAKFPTEATTIHRLLRPMGPDKFFYNEHRTLMLDVLILDEASMVDLDLMVKLFKALPSQCQVVLLGDQHQLSSVEAGNLIAEFCLPIRNKTELEQQASMPQTELKISRRFNANSDIGKLANAVNGSDLSEVQSVLVNNSIASFDETRSREAVGNDVNWMLPSESVLNELVRILVKRQQDIIELANAITIENEQAIFEQIYQLITEIQVLTCIRNGEFGVAGINLRVEKSLEKANIKSRESDHYQGRLILIAENAYHLQLFNGDIGVQLREPITGKLVTYFKDNNGKLRKIFNQRLPRHDSVYAMTIHKSQGSEFNHTIVVLPNQQPLSPVLNKELLYTGITRSIDKFTLIGEMQEILATCGQHSSRLSGIGHMLDW